MPINLYVDDKQRTNLAWLCDESWDLPEQIDALEKWVKNNSSSLKNGRFIADIGFSIRKNAGGGGAVLSSESMRLLANHEITIFFSEYPPEGFMVLGDEEES
jgi:hypothetical protein